MSGWFARPPSARSRRVALPGLTMNVVEAGEGAPVLLIHGLGWDHSLWGPTIELLAADHHVLAADTRGHGLTDAPEGPYGIDLFARDYAALLDALGLSPVCIVGLSQGGMVAQALALARPDLVSSLVLVSTSSRSDPAAQDNMEARLAAMETGGPLAAATVAADSIFAPGWRADHPDEVARFVAWRAAMPIEPLKAATRAAYGFDVKAELPRLSVPTLVIAGAEDRLTPPAGMTIIADSIPGARLVIIPGAGHILAAEQPDAFHAHLIPFVQDYATLSAEPAREPGRA